MAVPGANFGGKRVGSKGLKITYHNLKTATDYDNNINRIYIVQLHETPKALYKN